MDAYNPKYYETALNEWRPLAEQGNADAQFYLGLMYQRGYGVPQDNQQARHWWEKAAAQGLVDAQFNLGLIYENGEGVPQDHQQGRGVTNGLGLLWRPLPRQFVRASSMDMVSRLGRWLIICFVFALSGKFHLIR